MRTRTKLTLAGLTATLLMGLAVSAASASHLRVTNQNFRVTWSGLKFLEEGGGSLVTCPVTLEGSFHSATIAKVLGSLIGVVTRATVGNSSCSGGHATILQATLPWHVRYNGFTGILPNITGVGLALAGVAFNVEVFFVNCLYKENGTETAAGTAAVEPAHAITSLNADNTIRLPKFSGGSLCPASGGFEGAGNVTVTGSTTKISVTLI